MIRSPKVAGAFYPGEQKELKKAIDNLMKGTKPRPIQNLKALVLPHAGYIYSGPIAAVGYKIIGNPKKIILLGPSHRFGLHGGAYDKNDEWKTPMGISKTFKLKNSKIPVNQMAHAFEHSIEVQIPFIQVCAPSAQICPISIGSYDQTIVDEIIASFDTKENVLLIISTDLSHYLPYAEAVRKDGATLRKLVKFEKINHDEACGAEALNILSEIAKKQGWVPKVFEYLNSGDTSGDKKGVVGYTCVAYEGK